MITVIAEKPSVGKEIAHFLGATNKKEGYLEGNGYCVTWAYGHLLEIKDFKELGFSGEWNINLLPFIPQKYSLKLKEDNGARKQYKIIAELFSKSNEIVCATDAGREGELIFRYIYDYSKSIAKIKRLWVSSLTDEALKKAFNNLLPGNDYINLYNAAKARNQADYLVGLNATIGLTSKAGIGLLSLGRVQTPTLALICQRFLENTNFIPVPYFNVKIQLDKSQHLFFATSKENFETKEKANSIYNIVEGVETAIIEKVENKEKREQPPLLFDLTSLQMEANKKFGITANITLETAQALYESKYITYPRTGSCYIGDDIYNEIPALINKLQNYSNNFNGAISNLVGKSLNKRSVNAEKVTDHHALLTTSIIPTNFSNENQKIIYELIAGRLLEAFSDVCIKDITSVVISVKNIMFSTSGTIIKKLGWRIVYNDVLENEDADAEATLPKLIIGEKILKTKTILNELFTKAKPLHTEASILDAMETCGKMVDDDILKETLKENGIGTPATRASIIETLIKRNYIARLSKHIIPTPIGLEVYHFVKDIDISKVDLTGQWENRLLKMERGQYDYVQFNNEIESYTHNLINLIKNSEIKIQRQSVGNCNCGGNIIESIKAFECDNVKLGKCNFPTVWKIISKKTIPVSEIINLFQSSKTGFIKGFKNKENKSFDAALILKDNKILFDFTTPDIGTCPNCKKGTIKENNKAYSCDAYKEGCQFVIWKEIAGKAISQSIIKILIERKTSPIIKGFKGKTKLFNAALKLDEHNKVIFIFEKTNNI